MTRSLGFCAELDEAWKLATAFAGIKGRLATMPDVVRWRINTPLTEHSPPTWHDYMTTTSAEFVGKSAQGTPLIIVSHETHLLSSWEGIKKSFARGEEIRKKDYRKASPRITRKEFLDLESGKYGDVSIVPLYEFVNKYKYPWMEALTLDEALMEPLVAARLGPQWEKYIHMMAEHSTAYQKALNPHRMVAPRVIQLECGNNAPYTLGSVKNEEFPDPGSWFERYEDIAGDNADAAFGHLLVFEGMVNMGYCGLPTLPIVNVGIHEPSHHSRVVAIQNAEKPDNYGGSFSAYDLKPHLIPAIGETAPMRRIMKHRDNKWYTTPLKKGASMDHGIPEYPISKVKKLSKGRFTTTVGGYYGFLRYDIKEVEAIAPEGANAYVLEDCGLVDTTEHWVSVVFYQADIDLTKRALSPDEIGRNPEVFLSLL